MDFSPKDVAKTASACQQLSGNSRDRNWMADFQVVKCFEACDLNAHHFEDWQLSFRKSVCVGHAIPPKNNHLLHISEGRARSLCFRDDEAVIEVSPAIFWC